MSIITSVERACRLLAELAHMGRASMSDLARVLDLPTSTVDRILRTLAREGFVDEHSGWGVGIVAAQVWARFRRAKRALVDPQERETAPEIVSTVLLHAHLEKTCREPSNPVESVRRACRLLREGADMGVFRAHEIASALELPSSTVDRLIGTLAQQGFLERMGDGWQIGHGLVRLWSAFRIGRKRAIAQAQQDLDLTQIPGEA